MPEITYRQALKDAMIDELERDENVVIIGEEVAQYNGAYKESQGMLEQFAGSLGSWRKLLKDLPHDKQS